MNTLRLYRSPRGFAVVPIHYSHDSEKGAAWVAEQRSHFTRLEDWEREMEINFQAQTGSPAYPNYKDQIHLIDGSAVRPGLPLCLCMDFNVQPMVWEVAQIWGGLPYFLDEVVIDNDATVQKAVLEFRNRYPAHRGELHIYGDATGKARGQTAQSDYQLVELAFRGYPSPIVMKVPAENPREKDRINAVNRKLLGQDGKAGLYIDKDRCPELVKDFREVVTGRDGKVKKVYDPKDPYSRRTHASDDAGYFIWREWPISSEIFPTQPKAVQPLRVKHVLGALR